MRILKNLNEFVLSARCCRQRNEEIEKIKKFAQNLFLCVYRMQNTLDISKIRILDYWVEECSLNFFFDSKNNLFVTLFSYRQFHIFFIFRCSADKRQQFAK